MAEFDLIARIRARATTRADVALGIGDDAALLQPPPGEQLAVTADTLNDGVHFPHEAVPAGIGWKSLAVNLSDLAAMGARPLWCTLSLSLPAADEDFVDAFLDGFLALAAQHQVALVGGDITRGPLSIAVTAIGSVPAGQALRRDAAVAGDDIWVTGTPGDAGGALGLWRDGRLDVTCEDDRGDEGFLRRRMARPEPRVAMGLALRGVAHACVDLSDGLLPDLGHVCARSGTGARLHLDDLPASPALARLYPEATARARWQLLGGDDYELCLTAAAGCRDAVAAAARAAGVQASRIGRVVEGEGVEVVDAQGRPWPVPGRGFEHFA